MDTLHDLLYGFSVALQPGNLFLVFVGCFLGTLVGVLPGIGPVGAISILLPMTFQMESAGAIIMLAGIYYGVMYGGSTTSILVNVPGETASVVTCLDGYRMARQGRAGPALGIAAFSSFFAGTIGLIGLQLIAGPLATIALKFGPPEYFAIIVLAFTFITFLSRGSSLKAGIMALVGLILSGVGLDPITSQQRMTFGILNLFEGIGVAPLAMGLFGVAEVFNNLETVVFKKSLAVKIKDIFPTRLDWLQAKWAIVRGTLVGFFLGILPGGGPVIATFIAYGVEKATAKNPERFGKGAIEGVASSESANNAAASTSFIPLLTLGIPPNVVLAVLLGTFLIHGVLPGPLLIKEHPDVFWGLVGSMYIGNAVLLILNLPLIPLWVQVLKIPDKILYPLILLFCLIGAYSINNNVFDIVVMVIFGIVGYLFRKTDYEGAPLIMAFVLGPMVEVNLRRSLLISQGSFSIFFTRPIALGALLVSLVLVIFMYRSFRKRNRSDHTIGELEKTTNSGL
ncbi:MAG: tripartite tricarboxylate transporter permease [Deltaproteobacteria bacterium]|nr:tripartite tricarboxylate transporter permease [Deltaproteobacteria bacterium]